MSVRQEGSRQVSRRLEYYNLDAIISVGYRVKSRVATQFRQWATHVLHDHLIRGYTVNEQRLKELNQAIRLMRAAGIPCDRMHPDDDWDFPGYMKETSAVRHEIMECVGYGLSGSYPGVSVR